MIDPSGRSLVEAAILSAGTRDGVPAERNQISLIFRSAREIALSTPSAAMWIAKPWVALGALTELDGKVKVSGKTTFVTHMVRSILDGSTFLAEATMKTPVVYLTEQNDASFREALRRAGLLEREDLSVLTWSQTTLLPWYDVVMAAAGEAQRISAKLIVVDTLPQFAGIEGDGENTSGRALDAVRPLQQVVGDHGVSVLVTRHERKSGGEVGDSGRGSSAFAGAADIVISLRRPEGNANPNLRVIHGVGRFDETPDTLVIEFREQGYRSLGSEHALGVHRARTAIEDALPRSEESALILEELVATTGQGRSLLQEALKAMKQEGIIETTGDGKRGSPHAYYLK